MNKKILVGSIVAVAILIGVSFTSVVGYNGVSSDVKASPLFTVRSSMAIDEESRELTCDYVGKGEKIAISLPTRQYVPWWINEFVENVKQNPNLLDKAFISVIIHPETNAILKKVGITKSELLTRINEIKRDPDIFKERFEKAIRVNPKIGEALRNLIPEPTGLDTSNGLLACLVNFP